MGIEFPNPIGLAAGMDKEGKYVNSFKKLGFGSVEVGTFTPRPQFGNSKPRILRLVDKKILINRMGFNNKGICSLVKRVNQKPFNGILGISIGKNFDTPINRASYDYIYCLQKAYSVASYIVMNISSPNTIGLRDLENPQILEPFLKKIYRERLKLIAQQEKRIPLLIKISPDLLQENIKRISELLIKYELDGIVATNTTSKMSLMLSKETVDPTVSEIISRGGLSGEPLKEKSLLVIQSFNTYLKGAIPIIGCGGIMSGEDAIEMIDAGAELVQIFTGLIFRGPVLLYEIANQFRLKYKNKEGVCV
jgi:dihydroorotate dehydrogenase